MRMRAWIAALAAVMLFPAGANATEMHDSALALGGRVADWQLARMHEFDGAAQRGESQDPRGWIQGAFWVGMTRFADASGEARYRDAILARGRRNQWRLGERRYHADDHVIGQSYLWAARHGAGADAIAPMRATFDAVLAAPSSVHLSFVIPEGDYGATRCLDRWCWCDALFMAPPALLGLSRQTGDARYGDFALREFWATVAFLYDEEERLFFRDSRFFERRDAHGRKLFWSRGNGWVFAGLANMLEAMATDHPERARIERLFIDMAERLRTLQKPDGYWAPSLLAAEGSPPETSGTGFYVYGMAWGVNHGLLARADYTPTIRAGWAALARAVAPDGRLGWVQQVSDRPDAVAETDTQFYGVGAFLLAASAVAEFSHED